MQCICINCTFVVPNAPLQKEIWYTENGTRKLLLPLKHPSPTLVTVSLIRLMSAHIHSPLHSPSIFTPPVTSFTHGLKLARFTTIPSKDSCSSAGLPPCTRTSTGSFALVDFLLSSFPLICFQVSVCLTEQLLNLNGRYTSPNVYFIFDKTCFYFWIILSEHLCLYRITTYQ